MIENGVEVIKIAFERAVGDGKFIVLYLITLIVAFMYIKDNDNRTFLINYVIVIMLIIFNPIIASILNDFLDGGVYWRLFWCIPLGITVAYVFTEMIFNNEHKYKKIIVAIALLGVIIFAGEITYTSDIFYDTDNWLKLPDEHVEIVYTIIQDMKEDTVLLFAPPEINAHVRQITSKIKLYYERSPEGNYATIEPLNCFIAKEYNNGIEVLKKVKCNYVIWSKQDFIIDREDVQIIFESPNYYIYKINY